MRSQAASPGCRVGVARAMDEITFQQPVTPCVCTIGMLSVSEARVWYE
jgi:hypothetical protein